MTHCTVPRMGGTADHRIASQGTVNALFRIGDQLAARFLLQPAGVDETRRWLESEAGRPVNCSVVLPSRPPSRSQSATRELAFPLPWSVQTWLPGTTATESTPATRWHSVRTWPRSLRGAINRYPRSDVR